MPHFNEEKFKKVCDEITETCDCKSGYCFYRLLVTKQHPSLRLLIQMECMEKFKWEESERHAKDIGEDAYELWVTNGLAEAFAEAYNEDKSVKQIYKETLAIWKKKLDEKQT